VPATSLGAVRPTRAPAYLDHAATTPMSAAAIEAMTEQFARVGNASSLHAAGRQARRVVEEAREEIADLLAARPSEVVFTSGGTEADNLAVKGTYWARHAEDPARTRVIASRVEHHAVLDAVRWLGEFAGADVEWAGVDPVGRIDLAEVRERIEAGPGGPDSIALVTCMWANNEVGTVQPVADLADLASRFGIPTHSDAVQAVGQLPVLFDQVALSSMAVTGHKLGGPVGVGALLLRRDVALVPLTHGGGQEREVRSGTLDVPAIAGFAAALAETVASRDAHAARMRELTTRLVDGVRAIAPDVRVGGDPNPAGRLPALAHLTFPDCEADSLLLLLDAAGVECSTGSACSAGVPLASHVLLAMGYDERTARSALRFSLGAASTAGDVERLLEVLPEALDRARAAGRVGESLSKLASAQEVG
jgi:cysteine desulfurase